jgi:riboflavin kinase/FMN adenylyltransferase
MMEIIRLSYPLQNTTSYISHSKQVMAIGDFDGVHLGHREVIGTAVKLAKQQHMPAAIMTFDPHPREVLGISKYARYLAPYEQKMKLIQELGVDFTYIIKFDKTFAGISPLDFISTVLLPLRVQTVVVGFDFTFGHKGHGTSKTLKELCEDKIAVHVVEPYHIDGNKVSSTLIREQLQLSHLQNARKLLGRCYEITGHVVEGEKRGRLLGFPTANIRMDAPYVMPGNGVYAVKVQVNGNVYSGLANIGVKPTFAGNYTEPVIEVHLLDFTGSIYGERMNVEFIDFIRPEVKFGSAEELVRQIHHDIESAKRVFAGV